MSPLGNALPPDQVTEIRVLSTLWTLPRSTPVKVSVPETVSGAFEPVGFGWFSLDCSLMGNGTSLTPRMVTVIGVDTRPP